jgi:hypothetical protein
MWEYELAIKQQARLAGLMRMQPFPMATAMGFPPPGHRGQSAGFSRIELAVILAMLAFAALALGPATASNSSNSHRALCANNLRLLGSAMQDWVGDRAAGQLPWRTPTYQGGTFTTPKVGNVWFEMLPFTNELTSPKVLACPADTGAQPAPTWQAFTSSAYRQRGTSYSISLDVGVESRAGFVAGDLNIRYDGGPVQCSSGINNGMAINIRTGFTYGSWTNAIHGNSGHVLLFDGAVEFTTSSGLTNALANGDDAGAVHVLSAR